MEKFQLELLFKIIGLGSASGIYYSPNTVSLISDNAGYWYEYQIDNQTLQKTPILEGPVIENIPKTHKPDFEAMAVYGDDCFIFGSGSGENRNKMVQLNRTSKEVIATFDMTNLYMSMQSFGEIKPTDFNIEGVVFTGETWYFFQRGNDGTGKNGVFTVQGKNLEDDFSILFNSYKLHKTKGIEFCFTDATLVKDVIYFLATAENTKNAYDDGAVLGSIVGRLDIKKMKINWTQKISNTHKFEGITLLEETKDYIRFLLCEDKDTDQLESDIYKLTLHK